MKLIFFSYENTEPESFSRIISPANARSELDRSYLFGGAAQMSICSRYNIMRKRQSGRDIPGFAEEPGVKRHVFDEINHGSLLAIDEVFAVWSPLKHPFYIDEKGKLQRYPGSYLPAMYPVSRIIGRYEEMVSRYARRPRPTPLPSRQNLAKESPLRQAIATVAATVVATVDSMRPMTKAERWQERKYLIDRGSRSLYPDAMIAARRLAENNIAVEKAKLAQNIYGVKDNPINALKSMPNVPEGWTDISNDNNALSKFDLTSDMLYDRSENPDFFARIYSPDKSIFGSEMNPTLVFRGSRAPELSAGVGDVAKKVLFEGDYSGIKNINDWANNINQGGGFDSDYYRKAVKIGMKLSKSPNGIDISGHSLGGGMASAASIASGKPAWTFNAAGVNAGTVKKYGGTLVGGARNIQAYRVEGELLTKLQEVNLLEDYKSVNGNLHLLSAKEGLSSVIPDAVGIKHTLPGGKGSLLDRHGIDQAIDCIEGQKDEDIAIIRGRI